MSEQTKELEKKVSNLPAEALDLDAWGERQIVTSNDIIIPKILPMNFMSEKVKDGEAAYGEMRDTLANKKFSDLNTTFEFVPFYMEKKWYEFDIITNKAGAKKREFARVVSIQDNPTKPGYNDDLKYAEATVERDRVVDVYVLIPSEIEQGLDMPYVLSFRRTSLRAGKKLLQQMFVANYAAGKVPAAVTMKLSTKSVSNDDGEFVVMDVNASRESSAKEISECLKWLKLIRAGQTKLDDSDVVSNNDQAPEVPKPVNKAQYGNF